MTTLRAFPPLPVKAEWAPSYLAARPGAINRDFAFGFEDAQGAPSNSGRKFHSAVDWFAPAETRVCAPRAGRIVRFQPGGGDSHGAVFGGVIALEEPSGILWVLRHVEPIARLGTDVQPGEVIATVHRWDGGAPHLHMEVWRSGAGGYRHENMLDPADVQWDHAALIPETPTPEFFLEELPHTSGGTGPAIVGQAKGYANAAIAAGVAAILRARGEIVSTVAGQDGRSYVLSWAKGTYGLQFRFGPWNTAEARDAVRRQREGNTGRTARPYSGRAASLYPWPDNS